MKTALVILGSAVIGVITTACGLGWIDDGSINPAGAFTNVLCVVFWIVLMNYVDSKIGGRK